MGVIYDSFHFFHFLVKRLRDSTRIKTSSQLDIRGMSDKPEIISESLKDRLALTGDKSKFKFSIIGMQELLVIRPSGFVQIHGAYRNRQTMIGNGAVNPALYRIG